MYSCLQHHTRTIHIHDRVGKSSSIGLSIRNSMLERSVRNRLSDEGRVQRARRCSNAQSIHDGLCKPMVLSPTGYSSLYTSGAAAKLYCRYADRRRAYSRAFGTRQIVVPFGMKLLPAKDTCGKCAQSECFRVERIVNTKVERRLEIQGCMCVP